MRLALVWAMDPKGVIGRGGGLPWRLPDDLAHFKLLTRGHPCIMGRRTFASLGRPLQGRRNLVLSRDPRFRPDGAEVFASLDEALAACARDARVFVIGGAEVYRQALPRADELWVTRVDADVEGDVTFPSLDFTAFRLVSSERHERDARHAHAFTIERYERA
jgi:dihydrofolate reductase